MQKIPFNFDWKFTEGPSRFFMFAGEDLSNTVDLPHDYIINLERDPHCPGGSATGFYPGSQGSYAKEFSFADEWQEKTVLLDVDGAYMNAEVFLNGDKLAFHPYGYTAFQVDLSKRLRKDIPNALRISTQTFQPSSRWYSGGGLYREVNLLVGGKQYIHPWDVFVTTPEVSAEKAVVMIAVEVSNTCGKVGQAALKAFVIDENGKTVDDSLATGKLAADVKTAFALSLEVLAPSLWDVEEPHLYTLRLELSVDGQAADISETVFGIRKIEIDARNGMRLNGKKIKMRGGCIHHDNSLLGACAFPAAEERKIRILKDSGYNAIRTAHNPPSSALLDACDRLGMLVLDESFDMWRSGKNSLDYHLWFEDWWQRDTAAMVKRDRNHACIYCWSIGNEVQELLGVSDGAEWAKVQADYVRSLDPTRPVTAAANGFTAAIPGKPRRPHNFAQELAGKPVMGMPVDGEDIWGDQTLAASKALDLFGYNYMFGRYAYDREKFPERVIHATETHSFYTYDYWKAMQENENCIGDFIWTAYDNLGEAGAGRVIYDPSSMRGGLMGGWPWLSCYQGDHDLSGNRRPQAYYRKVMWGLDDGIHLFTTHPDLTGKPFYGMGWHWEDVKKDWSFGDAYIGKPVKLSAYADCDEVEFLVNGRSMGRVQPEELKAFLEVPYEPGKVEAISWRGDRKVSSDVLFTAGKPAKLVVQPEKTSVAADGMDLAYLAVLVVDSARLPVVSQPVEISVQVSGAGRLAGVGSGNPCTEENYGTGKRMSFDGKVLVCVRAGREAGEIRVEATAASLAGDSVVLDCE